MIFNLLPNPKLACGMILANLMIAMLLASIVVCDVEGT